MVKVISLEPTPNPDALKFVVDSPLLKSGVRSYDDAAQAKGDALAEAIFGADPEVQSVFYMDRFVTVRKSARADWDDLEARLVPVIEEKAAPAQEAMASEGSAASGGDVLRRIHEILDENVRPALAGDGGGLEVIEFQDNVLTVHYQGACGSCPSSKAGTLIAIQNLLQRMVDPQIQVVSD